MNWHLPMNLVRKRCFHHHGHVVRDMESYMIKHIEKYLDDIKQMFQYGEVSSSNKMNASKMHEQLMLKYPNRFSLPGEIEIKKTIGAFAQKQQGTSPKVLYQEFVTLIGNDQALWPSDLPTITTEDKETSLDMRKIKAIISSVKQKVRKDGKRSLLNY